MKRFFALVLAMALVPVFCLAETARIGIVGDPVCLEPNTSGITGGEIRILEQIYEGLVRVNADGDVEPLLASNWSVSADGLVYTFNLVPGVCFSDGTPVTGEDWEWSLTRARDAEDSEYAFIAALIDSVSATDTQVVITLKAASNAFLSQLCSFNMVVGCKAYAESMTEEEYAVSPMGTGPYRLAEWIRGEYVALEANPYYRGSAEIGRIEFDISPDDNTRLQRLQSGTIDVMGDVPASLIDAAKGTGGVEINAWDSTQMCCMLLNTTMEPFSDAAVREALTYAIDREALAAVVCGGLGEPAVSVVSEIYADAYDDTLEDPGYSPDTAKQLLADAGYTDPVNFVLTYPAGVEIYEEAAMLLQAQLSAAGFNATPDPVDSTVLYERAQGLQLQSMLLRWADDYADPSEVMGWIGDYDQSSGWFTGLDDPKLAELQSLALIEQDVDARATLYKALQRRVYENANVIPLFHLKYIYAAADRIGNLTVSAFNDYYCGEWTLNEVKS